MSMSANPAAIHAAQAVRLDAWRAVFEKTNRIISERPISVQIVDAGNLPYGFDKIPGWSDGETVHFNGPLVLDMLAKRDPVAAVLRLKGLNYHELSHVLYTPRLSDELPRKIIDLQKQTSDNNWWYSFNALEDQRIETWFSATYGPSRRYFEAAILQWLVDEGNADVAILVYGRKYLPARIRVQAGRVFVKKYGKTLYDEFQMVIDAYLGVRLPQESVRAFGLVKQYHALLQRMSATKNGHIPNLPIRDNGCAAGAPQKGDPSAVRKGRVLVGPAKEARDRAQDDMKKAAAADAEAEKDLDGAGSGDMPGPEAEEGQGDGSGQGEGSQGDQAGPEGPGQSQGGQQEGGQGAGTSGTGDHEIAAPADFKDLADAVRSMVEEAYDGLDEIRDDERIMNDVEQILDAVKAVEDNGRITVVGAKAKQATKTATEQENLVVRKVAGILMKIRQDLEPQTLRRQTQGRVDIRRVLGRRPNEIDIFTRWDEGAEEATGIEAVLLMDVSGSMTGRKTEASTALWALKRAFDRLEIRCTALVYDTNHGVLFQPNDKAGPSIPIVNSGGGTNPMSALQQAHLILSKSNAPNKVMINVTDGSWSCGERYVKPLMKHLHGQGTVTMLLGLNGAVASYGAHFHQHHHDLESVRDLPKVALKLVAGIMRAASNRV